MCFWKKKCNSFLVIIVVVYSLSCVWLFCDTMDCRSPSSSVHGILQPRIVEWVAISFSPGSSQPRDWTHMSCLAVEDSLPVTTRETLSNLSKKNLIYLKRCQVQILLLIVLYLFLVLLSIRTDLSKWVPFNWTICASFCGMWRLPGFFAVLKYRARTLS